MVSGPSQRPSTQGAAEPCHRGKNQAGRHIQGALIHAVCECAGEGSEGAITGPYVRKESYPTQNDEWVIYSIWTLSTRTRVQRPAEPAKLLSHVISLMAGSVTNQPK